MTARRVRLVLAYDGSGFHGWQRQPDVRTVQAVVEDVLRRLVRHPLAVVGASRTDAGVHAARQVACFTAETPMPLEKLRRALADRLPADVALVALDRVRPEFHPSLAARGKLYRYRIFNSKAAPTTQLRGGQTWHVWYGLDTAAMVAAGRAWVGTHDMVAFATAGHRRENTVRTVTRVEVRRRYDEVVVDVAGDGFLYNQVRNMVGTLVEIGRGRWPVSRAAEILASRDRRNAGPTAPPQGLCLRWIQYDPHWGVPDAVE